MYDDNNNDGGGGVLLFRIFSPFLSPLSQFLGLFSPFSSPSLFLGPPS